MEHMCGSIILVFLAATWPFEVFSNFSNVLHKTEQFLKHCRLEQVVTQVTEASMNRITNTWIN